MWRRLLGALRPPRDTALAGRPWQLWTVGEPAHRLSGITPQLASWYRAGHPTQERLARFLDEVDQGIARWSLPAQGLTLHLEIDVGTPDRLLRGCDLENYLTPLVQHLRSDRFCLASARKQTGGGSALHIGLAHPLGSAPPGSGWTAFQHHTGSVGNGSAWKQRLRTALTDSRPKRLPSGPVEVHLAWRCGRRNWVNLWKITGDAMGPVLGEPDPTNPFNPADDRIVSLHFHLNQDTAMGHDVEVGLWWRPAATR